MSDLSQGPGWWQASDGKWYPPELAPGAAPPPPPVPQAPAPQTPQPTQVPQQGQAFPQNPQPTQWQQPQQPAYQQPVGPPPKQGMHGCLKALLIGLAICAVLALAIGACTVLIADDVKEALDEVVEEAEQAIEEAEREAERAAEELEESADETGSDVDGGVIGGSTGDAEADAAGVSCASSLVGSVEVGLTNDSATKKDYQVTVDLIDDESGSLGQTEVDVLAVLPGEQVAEQFESPGVSATGCEVLAVFSTEATTGNDLVDDAGDCTVSEVAGSARPNADISNSSDEPAAYEVVAAVIDENGVRRGLATGTADLVEPGATDPLQFTSNVLAIPPGEFRCEIRTVTQSNP